MRRALYAALVAMAAIPSANAASVQTGWSQFRGNAQHTSSTTVTAPLPTHPRVRFQVTLPSNSNSTSLGEGLFGNDSGSTFQSNQRARASVSIGTGGKLFIPYGITMAAVSANDGSLLWLATGPASSFPNPTNAGFTQPAVVSTNVAGVPTELVITSSKNVVTAFRADTGAIQWQASISATDDLRGPVTIGPEGNVYVPNCTEGGESPAGAWGSGGGLYAFRSSNGGYLWTAALSFLGPAALSPDGSKVYSAEGGNIYEYSALNGTQLGSFSLILTQGGAGVAVHSDGTVFAYKHTSLVNALHTVVQLSADLSTKLWESTRTWGGCCTGDYSMRNPPTLSNNSVFVMDSAFNHQLTSLNLAGTENWSQSTSLYSNAVTLSPTRGNFDNIDSPPTLVGGGTVYMTDATGSLMNIEPADGSLRWKYQFANFSGGVAFHVPQNMAGQVAVSTNGVLFALFAGGTFGTDRVITAIEESGATNLAVSSNPARVDGNIWVTTITIQTTNGVGGGVVNSPAELSGVQQPGIYLGSPPQSYSFNPLARMAYGGGYDYSTFGYANTNNLGISTFSVTVDLSQLPHGLWATQSATATARVMGFPTVNMLIKETRASTFTITVSTPSIEDDGVNVVRVTTLTYTVTNSTGGPVPSFPVGLDINNYPPSNFNPLCGVVQASTTPAGNFQLTNSAGQATYTLRLTLSRFGVPCVLAQDFSNFTASVTAYALGLPAVGIDTREIRSSTFTFSLSTGVIQSDVRSTTVTVTAYDVNGSTVPNTIVELSNLLTYTSSGPFTVYFKNYNNLGGTGCAWRNSMAGYTDAFGQAKFVVTLDATGSPGSGSCGTGEFDTFSDFRSSFSINSLNVPVSTTAVTVESNYLNNYRVDVPTTSAVGISFTSTVTARNLYNHKLGRYSEAGVNLVPLLSGTNVQGTGSLATNQITFLNTSGQVVISSQNYNKVETIQVKAVRANGTTTGLSQTIVMTGPYQFNVFIPTAAQAGIPFPMTVQAVDGLGNQLSGYTATLSLSALQAGNTTQAGAGILGTTNINLPPNGILTINQTYTKSESIKIRASDSGLGVIGVSTTTLAVLAGTPASLTLSANPQSTVASVPSVLNSTVLDLYSNPVSSQTVSFSIINGSGTVALSFAGLPSNVISTNAVTNSLGQAQAFFGSTNTTSSQADVLRASVGSLVSDTTIYNSVLIGPGGGLVSNLSNSKIRATVPANAYGFNVRMGAQSMGELTPADLAVATAALARMTNTFVSSAAAKFTAVKDTDQSAPGKASQLVTIELPVNTDGSGNVTVGALSRIGPANLLVPLSVMRVFELNNVTNVFNMVMDGTNLPNASSGTVAAQVSDPNGIFVIGAPPYSPINPASSGTITTMLASGASVQVNVPVGGFASPTTLQVAVTPPANIPALPQAMGLNSIGLAVLINTTDGQQPIAPISVTIGYKDSDLGGVDPTHLRLARYDVGVGWTLLNSSVDTTARQITGTTNHFSIIAAVAASPGDLSQGFAFPNPFQPGKGNTNLKFANLPANAHLKIYTSSGKLLKELDADGVGQVLTWDGTDENGRQLPSGVYLALVSSAGKKTTLKFSVQR